MVLHSSLKRVPALEQTRGVDLSFYLSNLLVIPVSHRVKKKGKGSEYKGTISLVSHDA